MSSRTDREFLADILEAIRRGRMYVDGMDYDQFMADLKTQDAVVRALEVIGEAAKRLSPAVREQHASIPWKNMAGLRDKLIHDYFGVNLDIVWQIVTQELPPVALQLEQMLAEGG
ncbi:MAG TPA: DUF86 domain-containing protein [Thermoanaerobaculia bacterium]|nr:DUF86 domain-containing protein [Thermoanaerobaculia bacterium]